MATKGLYAIFKQRLANKELDLDTDVLKAVLIRTIQGAGAGGNAIYTPNLATHDDLVDVANNVYCRVATATLTGASLTNGVITSNPIVFAAVAAGDAIQGLLLYDDTHASDALILFSDMETGQPITPNGTDITVTIADNLFTL